MVEDEEEEVKIEVPLKNVPKLVIPDKAFVSPKKENPVAALLRRPPPPPPQTLVIPLRLDAVSLRYCGSSPRNPPDDMSSPFLPPPPWPAPPPAFAP